MGNHKTKHCTKKNLTELTEAEIKYLLEHTHFSREEIVDWHEKFIKECPTGQIGKQQFKKVYKTSYSSSKADKFCDYVFNAFDTNNNGFIDFVEFLIPISITTRGDMREKLTMAFKMFDIDKNNLIDKKEMEKLILVIYDLTGEINRTGQNDPILKVITIMNKLDTNHDGVLSQEEFITGCLNDENLRMLLAPYASNSVPI